AEGRALGRQAPDAEIAREGLEGGRERAGDGGGREDLGAPGDLLPGAVVDGAPREAARAHARVEDTELGAALRGGPGGGAAGDAGADDGHPLEHLSHSPSCAPRASRSSTADRRSPRKARATRPASR